MRRATVSGTTIVFVQEMTSSETETPEPFDGPVPDGRPEPERPLAARRSWRHSDRLMPVLATIPLFAGIFALALGVKHPEDAVSVLYAIPIAILAIERGPIAGLAASAVGLGLFGLDIAISDEHVSALGFVTRA